MAPVMNAVVKVFCMHSEPSHSQPWQRDRQYSSFGSGFAIPGRRLLTNAHCVEYHSQVKVKRRGDDRKFLARVLAQARECDLAMLAVDDDAFWEGMEPVQFGGLPHLQDDVVVVGYPIGGDTISVTSGVVSRIESTSYVHGSRELLGVQIDAAINPGNSGGPVFDREGNCTGIAFQAMDADVAENIGWIIPTPVVSHFLTDYARRGTHSGFPVLGIRYQMMESPVLREAVGLGCRAGGIMVRDVETLASSHGVLQKGDVIMSFDGTEVAGDGTVPFRTGERISFGYLISQKFVGESSRLAVMRGGEELSLDVHLKKTEKLVPIDFEGRDPPYFIVAGLVFTVCSEAYLRSEFGRYGDEYGQQAPLKFIEACYKMQKKPGEQLVVLSQILVCDANVGYESDHYANTIVYSVNGRNISSLLELAEAVESSTERFLEFEVGMFFKEVVILDREKVAAATREILERHSVPAPASKDLTAELAARRGSGGGAAGGAEPAAAPAPPPVKQSR
jgi:S1-C subfamily serine protease